MRPIRLVAPIMLVLTLVACTTPDYYRSRSGGEKPAYAGYDEIERDDGSYELSVVLPARAGAALPRQIWTRRATELCGDADFEENIFEARRPTVLYDRYGGRPGGYILRGYLVCQDGDETASDHPETLSASYPASDR